ncbi:MAG TPA: cyclic nucleotide-binding domain-containing protein [Candidatus Deferrimicrobiaceae bacterium]|nr:cyclic nucleotide-binding domain-containing protein [Candidatus Deferrimicrobiaceae bacterium]
MMEQGLLGHVYEDGEVIVCQGALGDCMYVIEDGTVEIVVERDGHETMLRTAGPGELIGEMAIFEHRPRSATVRARGAARVLTLDKRNFMRRISEDPTLAFRIIESMARRVRELSDEVVKLSGSRDS